MMTSLLVNHDFWIILIFLVCFLSIPLHSTYASSTSNNSEYDAFKKFDKQLRALERKVLSNNNTPADIPFKYLVGFVILNSVKEDMWKQGGFWESLKYAEWSLQKLTEEPTLTADINMLLRVKYGLDMFKARLLINLGLYDEAIGLLDEIFHEQSSLAGALQDKQKLSNILLTKADAILPKGRKTDYSELIDLYVRSMELYPAAYHKLAVVFGLHYKSSNATHLSEQDRQVFFAQVRRLEAETKHALGHVLLSGPARVIYFSHSLEEEVCVYQHEYSGWDVLLPHSHLFDTSSPHTTSPEEVYIISYLLN